MPPLADALKPFTLPAVTNTAEQLLVLQFAYALTVAHRPLLERITVPLLFEREYGKAEWLRAEIVSMGAKPPEFEYTAACLVGSQYYAALHVHPKVCLGYFAAIEHLALPGTDHHRDRDPDTLQAFFTMVEDVALESPWLAEHLGYNARCSAAGIVNALSAKLRRTPSAPPLDDPPHVGTC